MAGNDPGLLVSVKGEGSGAATMAKHADLWQRSACQWSAHGHRDMIRRMRKLGHLQVGQQIDHAVDTWMEA
jgi:hypothetical protein